MDDKVENAQFEEGKDELTIAVRHVAQRTEEPLTFSRLKRIEQAVSDPPRPKASMTLVVVVILGFAALALIAWQTTTTLARIEHRQINYLENRPWQASPEPAPSDQSPTDPETPTPLK